MASGRRFLNRLYVCMWDWWLNKEANTAHGGAAQEPTVSANQFEDTLVLYKPFEIAAWRHWFSLLCSLFLSPISDIAPRRRWSDAEIPNTESCSYYCRRPPPSAKKRLHPAQISTFLSYQRKRNYSCVYCYPMSKCHLPCRFYFDLLSPLDALALCHGKTDICLYHRWPALCLQPLL